ncbi:MAG: hypothetical protein NTX14_00455 [Candidatus Nealsonbacteria bacterium]|nr:hypothetical protein [Candidatus Nealsonbacteria bacterium]
MDAGDIYGNYKFGMVDLLRSESVEPSDENLKILFPHLLTEEARSALDAGKFIATPPLMRRGTFHVVGGVSEKDHRLSYFGCFSLEKHNAGNILHSKRATDFGKMHFSGHYFSGNYQFVLNVILRRFGLNGGGLKAIWLLVDKDPAVIIGETKIVKSRQIDEAIVYKTVNPVKGREAAALRDMKVVYNCAHCGSPLRDQGCEICRDKEIDCYPDFRMGALPPTAIRYLMSKNHRFSKDPFLARAREETSICGKKS